MVKLQQQSFAKRAIERSCVYGLLSQVYRKEPNREFLRSFREPTFLLSLKELGIELGEYLLERRPLEETAEELAIEYTRLFIGPGKHIYPYEFAYCEKEGATAIQIKNLVESCGLKYGSDFHDDFDHISVELEFMEKITEQEAKAWKKKDRKKTFEFLKFEKQFLDKHLTKWVPEFSDKVIKGARLSFYREMAKLTREFILLEALKVKNLISQAEV